MCIHTYKDIIMDVIDLLIILYIVAGIAGWVYIATSRK